MSPDSPAPTSPPPSPESPLPTSGHVLLTYRGETPPWPSVVSFLTAGLADNRRLVYLHDRSEPGEIDEELREADLDVDQLTASGQLHFLAAEDHYLGDGGIEPEYLAQDLRAGLVDAIRGGFGGLQVVGEAGWIGDRVSPETLIEFERRADDLLGREVVEILCLYPAERWDDPVVHALKEVHGEHVHHPATDGGDLERTE